MCKMPENQLYSTTLELDNPIPADGQIYDFKFVREVSLKTCLYSNVQLSQVTNIKILQIIEK